MDFPIRRSLRHAHERITILMSQLRQVSMHGISPTPAHPHSDYWLQHMRRQLGDSLYREQMLNAELNILRGGPSSSLPTRPRPQMGQVNRLTAMSDHLLYGTGRIPTPSFNASAPQAKSESNLHSVAPPRHIYPYNLNWQQRQQQDRTIMPTQNVSLPSTQPQEHDL